LDFDPLVKYGGVGSEIDWKNGYIVVMQHPVSSEFEESLAQIKETIEAVDELGIPTFWFWPNVDAGSDGTSRGIRQFREKYNPKNIRFMKNMGPQDFLKLLYNSLCLIGNSSVGIRECSFLGVPVVNIGSRQDGRIRGKNVIDVKKYDREEIKNAIEKQLLHGKYENEYIYGDGKAGERIADILSKVNLRFHKKIMY
jgi:UDP-hydrolysing UDP-N-acetyl-D-glucosamine 2-epimerase